MFGRRKTKKNDPENPFEGLRHRALTLPVADLESNLPPESSVLGVVVDMPSTGGCATLVGLADGSTSLYTTTGGGVIGAGEHEAVSTATCHLLSVLQEHIEIFPADETTELPPPEFVQVTLLTPTGRHRGFVEQSAFWGRVPSTIPDIVAAIQNVMTLLREASPS